MDTLLLEQTEHLQNSLAAIEGKPGYWTLNRLLALRALSASLMLAGMSLDIRAIIRVCRALPNDPPIDPDDFLADKLLAMQKGLSEWFRESDPAHYQVLSGWQRGLLGLMRWRIRTLHGQIGKLRNYILEFDADASGPSGQGPFNNASDLIDSLDA